MRRVFWGLVGVGLGVVVGAQVVRWANRTKAKYSPPNLAREAGGKVAGLADRVRRTVELGLEEMEQAEAEIRAELGLPPQ
jgi:histidinol-phosphate/aromatic aminotransferase/cobyric acid decarboxylase-like protein